LLEKIAKKYLETDKKSGKLFLLAVLMEEIGEVAEAVRKGDKKAIEEELADATFVIFCLANMFEVNLEDKIIEKYLIGDPSKNWDLPD